MNPISVVALAFALTALGGMSMWLINPYRF